MRYARSLFFSIFAYFLSFFLFVLFLISLLIYLLVSLFFLHLRRRSHTTSTIIQRLTIITLASPRDNNMIIPLVLTLCLIINIVGSRVVVFSNPLVMGLVPKINILFGRLHNFPPHLNQLLPELLDKSANALIRSKKRIRWACGTV
jgi:hypothetical protein